MTAARTVRIATTSGGMPAYDAVPDGSPLGGVIVIQEAFGVTPHIEDVARRFATAGFRAIAPHLYYRRGVGGWSYDDVSSVLPHMQSLTERGLVDDIDAALGYLEDAAALAPARVAIVGFCMGGSVAALAAARRRMGAAVSFYGGGVVESRFGMPPLVELAPTFQTPWLGLYAGQDQGIPLDHSEALQKAAASASVRTDFVLYPDAAHGFHCDARPAAYHRESAEDAWKRTLAWLEEHLPQAR